MKINGEYLSHLRIADDILIRANTPHELQQMLHEIADESDNQGVKMNKSKVMMDTDTPIQVNNRSRTLKATSTWDRDIAPETKNQVKEIQRKMTPGWTAFAKHRDIFKGNIGTCLKRQVYHSCVLPALPYGAKI